MKKLSETKDVISRTQAVDTTQHNSHPANPRGEERGVVWKSICRTTAKASSAYLTPRSPAYLNKTKQNPPQDLYRVLNTLFPQDKGLICSPGWLLSHGKPSECWDYGHHRAQSLKSKFGSVNVAALLENLHSVPSTYIRHS